LKLVRKFESIRKQWITEEIQDGNLNVQWSSAKLLNISESVDENRNIYLYDAQNSSISITIKVYKLLYVHVQKVFL
jgi:hypothetical protein